MKHAELIARLEATEVGSRELDRDIELEIGGGWIGADEDRVYRRDKNGFGYTQAFRTFTTSLDAALALAERVLPGFGVVIDNGDPNHDSVGNRWCRARVWSNAPLPDGSRFTGGAKTLAMALCVAILRALDAQEQK